MAVHPYNWKLLGNEINNCYMQHLGESQKHYAEWMDPDSKEGVIPFIWHSRKDKTVRMETSAEFPGIGGMGSIWLPRGSVRAFSRVIELYLDCGGGSMTFYLCQNSELFTQKIWFYCMKFKNKKFFKKCFSHLPWLFLLLFASYISRLCYLSHYGLWLIVFPS